jgi:hypothetical protein
VGLWEGFFKDRLSCFVPDFLNCADWNIEFVGKLGPMFDLSGVSGCALKNLVLLWSQHEALFSVL